MIAFLVLLPADWGVSEFDCDVGPYYGCVRMNHATLAMWKRRVALVILTWALLDLSVPGLCPGEQEIPSTSTAAFVSSFVASVPHSIRVSGPVSDQTTDDDCWCCSSHVAPAPRFEATLLSPLEREEATLSERPSQGWSLPLYHPPRS